MAVLFYTNQGHRMLIKYAGWIKQNDRTDTSFQVTPPWRCFHSSLQSRKQKGSRAVEPVASPVRGTPPSVAQPVCGAGSEEEDSSPLLLLERHVCPPPPSAEICL